MAIYWLLFGFPALMALSYPVHDERYRRGAAQFLAATAFVTLYALVGGLREEIGGDWLIYIEIYNDITNDSLAHALSATDALYGLLNWVSALLGTGIYLVNGICCLILGVGVVRTAFRFREPWLAILIAVPYLLIVVGMGYVRQGAAIGMILIAISTLDRSRPLQTLLLLALAIGFHSTAVMAFPLFALPLLQRNRFLALLFGGLAVLAFVFVLAPRMAGYESGYLEAEYSSGGAVARIAMSLLPSLLILVRWRHFPTSQRVRSVWISAAVANCIAAVALVLSPSSTAVDRVALFFAIIQLAAFGEMRNLLGISPKSAQFLRVLLIGVAAAVQVVWLVFGTYSSLWVPYNSILQTF